MRILVVASAALLTQASYAAPPQPAKPAPAVQSPQNIASVRGMGTCRRTTSYNAESVWRDGRITPRKLTELPPATTYMAVYRTVNGCEEPLTMTEYRRSGR